ncbi:hypothetical protein GGI20_002553 [Coemansia sp. BCRC 34301]|nr:hypothetical protein GGI20_002553 [Coemansia sp. BCRC 34301]
MSSRALFGLRLHFWAGQQIRWMTSKKGGSSRRYMNRQIQDPFVRLAKAEQFRARSSFKLIEIIDKHRLVPKSSNTCVVDCGAAPGGWSQVIARRFETSGSTEAAPRIVAVDLIHMQPIPGVHIIQGDFLEQGVKDEVAAALGGRRVGLVLSDMAPSFTGHYSTDAARTMNLCEDVLAFAHQFLACGGSLVLKFFMGGGEAELRKALKESFDRVVVEKPDASRKQSSEQYFVRAGTHIDDLERQLARVGSVDNDDASADEGAAWPLAATESPTETTALLESNTAHRLALPPNARSTTGCHGLSIFVPQSQQQQEEERQNGANADDDGGNLEGDDAPRISQLRSRKGRGRTGAAARKLGTWDGVFLPVMLSIWGILVFVRMGYFLSQVGIIGTIVSFVCGYLVTTMTTLSISAISTNGTVKGGGPYYMLSRSLGPEFGGSIGLMFYAGTLLSGVLNAVAFVEPLLSNFGRTAGDITHTFPEGEYWSILYSSALLTFCTVVCLTGARVFAKASTVLSTFIIASTAMILVSFAFQKPFVNEEKAIHYTSWSLATLKENFWPDLAPIAEGRPSETFGTVLGVLFPACIGVMAGASMSSALRKPSKSIPKGTLWAVVITFFLYLTIIICLGSTTRRTTLRDNFNVLQEINILPIIVPIGAITTSVTSTLSGVLSSASILQAIAKDDLFACLGPLKRVSRSDNPTRAIVITFVISQLAFFMGDTNAVAPYTTMFNLIMFGFVNLACLVLKLAASVNFRPTFHYFKAWTAFLGAAGCFVVMLFVDMASALVSTGVVILLFLYVHYTCPPKPWGDVTQSLIYHQCRKYMLRLDLRKDHVKFWRPQILLLVHNPRSSVHLIRFCNALKKGGLYVIGHVIKGRFYDLLPELRQQESAWMRLIDVLHVKAFLNLAIDKDDDAGARSIIFGAGLGGMRPNIVVMGFLNLAHRVDSTSDDFCLGGLCDGAHSCDDAVDDMELPTDNIKLNSPISAVAYLRIIEDALLMGKAVGIAHGFSKLGSVLPPIPHCDVPSSQQGADLLWQAPLVAAESHPARKAYSKQYIDLWPIQIGTATTVTGQGDTRASYLTNFDSYVMVLQLGTVLHLVPYWNKHYILRVMCFVENKSDVAEEFRRVDKLLRDLRVMAELHVHYLRGAGLSTYEEASNEMAARQPPSLDDALQRESGASSSQAIPASHGQSLTSVGDSSAVTGAFSMKVNLPMPLRYEASRAGRRGSRDNSLSLSSGTTSSSEEDSDLETDSSPGYNSTVAGRTSILPRYATVSGTDPRRGQRTASGGAFWRKRRQSADPNRSRHVIIGNLPLGSKDVDISMRPRRRGSDGAMVLSDFYSRTLAAVASQVATAASPRPTSVQAKQRGSESDVPLEELSIAGGSHPPLVDTVCPGSALKSFTFASAPAGALPEATESATRSSADEPTEAMTVDFNDMPVNTQNRILNEMIRRECNGTTTALIFTTLQAPEPGTSDSETKAVEYLKDIDALAHGLPPVFLVHATSLTVTTSLECVLAAVFTMLVICCLLTLGIQYRSATEPTYVQPGITDNNTKYIRVLGHGYQPQPAGTLSWLPNLTLNGKSSWNSSELASFTNESQAILRTNSKLASLTLDPDSNSLLILTPVKNNAKHLDKYFALLDRLEYPRSKISLAFLVSDSTDQTQQMLIEAKKRYQKLGSEESRFKRFDIFRQDFFYALPRKQRHLLSRQRDRRIVMARARNYLWTRALEDEEWVLWIDGDLEYYPPNIVNNLMAYDKDIIVPNCLVPYKNKQGKWKHMVYDRNAWQETPASLAMLDKLEEDDFLAEGYKSLKTYRKYLDKFAKNETIVPLDGVGGAFTLVKSHVHRSGIGFPTWLFQHQVETEGFAKLAKANGYGVFGLPFYYVRHVRG